MLFRRERAATSFGKSIFLGAMRDNDFMIRRTPSWKTCTCSNTIEATHKFRRAVMACDVIMQCGVGPTTVSTISAFLG